MLSILLLSSGYLAKPQLCPWTLYKETEPLIEIFSELNVYQLVSKRKRALGQDCIKMEECDLNCIKRLHKLIIIYGVFKPDKIDMLHCIFKQWKVQWLNSFWRRFKCNENWYGNNTCGTCPTKIFVLIVLIVSLNIEILSISQNWLRFNSDDTVRGGIAKYYIWEIHTTNTEYRQLVKQWKYWTMVLMVAILQIFNEFLRIKGSGLYRFFLLEVSIISNILRRLLCDF